MFLGYYLVFANTSECFTFAFRLVSLKMNTINIKLFFHYCLVSNRTVSAKLISYKHALLTTLFG